MKKEVVNKLIELVLPELLKLLDNKETENK